MGTRRNFRRGWVVQNVKYPPCLASPGIAWAALVKGGSAYSTKAELIPLFSGALLGCPLSVYAGTAGSMAGAPGRWLCRGCRLGGALLLSFSGRSSFPFSPVSLSSPFHLLGGAGSAVWLAGGLHRLGAAGSPSVLLLALVAVLASLGAGAGRCPLPVLRPLPLLGAVSGLWCCCLPLPSLLGAGVPLLSSGAGLLCAGAGCWPWVG